METLDLVIDSVKQDPKYADLQPEINQWVADTKLGDRKIKVATSAISGATGLAAAAHPVGWFGRGMAAVGTASGLIGGGYNLERAFDSLTVANSQQVGMPISSTSIAAAKSDLKWAGIEFGMAGLDLGVGLKAFKVSNNIDNIGFSGYKMNPETGDILIDANALSPRIEFNPNPGGITRTTKEELYEIAQRAGIDTERMDLFIVDDLADDTWAEYGLNLGNEQKLYRWADFEHDLTGMVPVRVNKNILNSDEKIVATLNHESYEIEGLHMEFREKGMITQKELADLIDSKTPPAHIHCNAWDDFDELIPELREDGFFTKLIGDGLGLK